MLCTCACCTPSSSSSCGRTCKWTCGVGWTIEERQRARGGCDDNLCPTIIYSVSREFPRNPRHPYLPSPLLFLPHFPRGQLLHIRVSWSHNNGATRRLFPSTMSIYRRGYDKRQTLFRGMRGTRAPAFSITTITHSLYIVSCFRVTPSNFNADAGGPAEKRRPTAVYNHPARAWIFGRPPLWRGAPRENACYKFLDDWLNPNVQRCIYIYVCMYTGFATNPDLRFYCKQN